MTNKVTFREFVKGKEGERTPNYAFQNAYDYAIASILADETFPDDEVDGLEVRKYIRGRQLADERYNGNKSVYEYNKAVLYHFERLWEEYKERLKA